MRRHLLTTLKFLLLRAGSLLTLLALMLIVGGSLYLPLDVKKGFLEETLSTQINRPVQIESVETSWKGIFAVVEASGVRIRHGDETQSSLRIGKLKVSIDPFYFFTGEFRIERIVVQGLTLEIFRHLDGSLQIGDFVISEEQLSKPGILRWLLKQKHAEIRDSDLVWTDQREPGRPLSLNRVDIRLRNEPDGRTRFDGRADLSTESQGGISVNGVLLGALSSARSWEGEVDVSLNQLKLHRLPPLADRFLRWEANGRLNARIETRWENGLMSDTTAEVNITDFSIPLPGNGEQVAVDSFDSQLSWQRHAEGWQLSLQEPVAMVAGEPLRAGSIDIDGQGDTLAYQVNDLRIKEVTGVFDRLGLDVPWRERLSEISPEGILKQVSGYTKGPLKAPLDWRLEGDFEQLSWVAAPSLPGVSGVQGKLVAGPGGGSASLKSQGVGFVFSDTRRHPLFFDRFQADVAWASGGNEWVVDVDNLELNNPDIGSGRGNMRIRLSPDGSESARVNGRFAVDEFRVDRLTRYLPAGLVSPGTRNWLKNALLGGTFTNVSLGLSGALDRFPFRAGNGSFSLAAGIRDGTLRYGDRWPDLNDISGSLQFANSAFEGRLYSAEIYNSRVRSGTVTSSDIFARGSGVRVQAELSAPLERAISFLTSGPLIAKPSSLSITGTGTGELDLDIFLPLSDLKMGTRVKGNYVARNGKLTVADRFSFENLNGSVNFTEATVESTEITAGLLGGEVSIAVETLQSGRPPVWVARASGKAEAGQLVELFADEKISQRVSGSASWTGSITAKPGVTELEVTSDLDGAEMTLPEPLAKAAGEKYPLSVVAVYESGRHNYQFELGKVLGRVEVHPGRHGAKQRRGLITVGKSADERMPDQGFRIEILQPTMDADAWVDLIRRDHPDPATGNEAAPSPAIRELELQVGQLRFLGRERGRIYLRAASADGKNWSGWLSGDTAAGKVVARIGREEADSYSLNLDRLNLPERIASTYQSNEEPASRSYPDLEVHADQFTYGEQDLGKLELSTKGYVGRWRIDKLNMTQPGLQIMANGQWAYGAGGSSTQLRVSLHSDDIGIALRQLRFPPHIAEATVQLQLVLNWLGAPQDFALEDLGGSYDLRVESGRFLNVDPGSGRLLGLFNVDAISRRFSLDFSDIFSKGLTFDHIEGQGRISHGNLYSEGVFVVAPAALIAVKGRTGLVLEDYELDIAVAPQLSTQISMLSALANPLAGAMVFLAHQVFKEKLSRMIQYQYDITGSWESPTITAVRVEPELDIESEK